MGKDKKSAAQKAAEQQAAAQKAPAEGKTGKQALTETTQINAVTQKFRGK